MSTQLVSLSLPKDLVKKIDAAAKDEYASRSEYIRQAVVGRLRSQTNDIWASLEASAKEVSTKAEQTGYKSDEDFVRAVRESRKIAKTR